MRRATVVLLVLLAGFGVAATGASRGDAVSRASLSASARIGQATLAVETADRAVRGGTPYDINDERYRGELVWEVKIALGRQLPHVLLVRADGKRVVRRGREDELSDDAVRVRGARIGLARALEIAGPRARGQFSEAEFDRRSGVLVWEAAFDRSGNRKTLVVVHARTGGVIGVRTISD